MPMTRSIRVGPDAGADAGAAGGRVGRGDERVGAVVDVEHGGLRALEEHDLAGVERLVEHEGGVGDHRAQPLGVGEQVVDDLVDGDRAAVVDLHEQVVLLLEGALDLLAQDVLVEEVLDADAEPVDLVGVGRADAAAGGADLGVAEEPLGDLVDGAGGTRVIRCALALISSRLDDATPRALSASISSNSTSRSMTTPLPMTG